MKKRKWECEYCGCISDAELEHCPNACEEELEPPERMGRIIDSRKETLEDIKAREDLIKKINPKIVYRCEFRPKGINV